MHRLSTALRLALFIVRAVALLVPPGARVDWKREWEAELQHLFEQRRTHMGLISRALGSLADAAWVRHLLKFNQPDFRISARRLFRSPAFVTTTVGTLTLGLGLFAVVYTMFDKVLIEPMPYKDPDNLYFVWRELGPTRNHVSLPGADILELQKAGGVIESAVALQPFLGGVFSLREGIDPIEISVTVTSPGLFEMLGVTPMLGRSFLSDDAGPGRPFTIVLTHGLWSLLGADPQILGRVVSFNGRPHTVIGVLPPDFRFVRNASEGPAQRPDAYTNLRVNLTDPSPNQTDYSALIRAQRGTPPQTVAAAVEAVGRIINERDFGGRGLKLYPVGLKADLVTRVRPALLVLGAAGAVLALMLMVNLASILLARAAQREQEFAVSRALGANSGALMRGTLIEGGLLGLMGGTLGTLFAIWGTRVLVTLAPLDLPRREEIAVGLDTSIVVVAIGTLLGLLAAAVPALWAAHTPLSSLLAGSAVRGGGGGHGIMRRGMIVAQVALSLVLLSSGALVVRSLEQLLRADPGFNPEGLFTVLVRTPPIFFPQNSDVTTFQNRVTSALSSLPGVTAASATSALPFTVSPTLGQVPIRVPGAPGNTGDAERDTVMTDVIRARAGYVEAMGMRIVSGRSFEEARPANMLEAMIDTTLARRLFPGANAVGMQVPFGNGQATVVGVVEQARLYDLYQDGRPQIYFRAEDCCIRPLFYVMRTARPPESLLPEVYAAIRQIDPRVAVGEARSMDEIVGNALRQQRTSATLITAFAVGALLLAAMGLFGVVSGSVTRRSHELAVRMALGADPRSALRLVLREGVLLVGIGILIGLPVVLAAGSLIRTVLVGVSPSDPFTLAAVALLLVVVTLVTCYVPARRVLKIDPAQLLARGNR